MFKLIRRIGLQRGLMGGSGFWLVLGGFGWLFKAMRWAWKKDEKIVYQEKINPGETLIIEHKENTYRIKSK